MYSSVKLFSCSTILNSSHFGELAIEELVIEQELGGTLTCVHHMHAHNTERESASVKGKHEEQHLKKSLVFHKFLVPPLKRPAKLTRVQKEKILLDNN